MSSLLDLIKDDIFPIKLVIHNQSDFFSLQENSPEVSFGHPNDYFESLFWPFAIDIISADCETFTEYNYAWF